MEGQRNLERIQTVVIGGGQAGLSVGYHLAQRGLPFVILDANQRVGDSWRHRWDSLRLFTPARFDGLDGLAFPAAPDAFPTKNEMADYLESYAARFSLPVRTRTRVTKLSKRDGTFIVDTDCGSIAADQVVVAMATYQASRIPGFAKELDPSIVQLDSGAYRNPAQLREGGVLLVGAGNSGAEIALEVARTHRTWMSGRDVGQVPFRIGSWVGRHLLAPFVLRVLFHRILTVDTPLGRKVRPGLLSRGGPLIRTRRSNLMTAGVERVARVTGVAEGRPVLADGRVMNDVANVIWCTGYHAGLDWIDLPVLDEHGEPRHERGLVLSEPGLYFVGLHFLYAFSSTMIHGVGRDASRVVDAIAERMAESVGTADGYGLQAAGLMPFRPEPGGRASR
jgi:putative flavoprotein involved in K+ transport